MKNRLQRYVRVGEWAILAFLGLALLNGGWMLYYNLVVRSLVDFPPSALFQAGGRVALFLVLYILVRRVGAKAFVVAAGVMAVLAVASLFSLSWLIAFSYGIGTYLEWRAARAARRLPRNGGTPTDDILDADMT